MRIGRLLLSLAAVAIVVFGAAPVHAQNDYPPPAPRLFAFPTTVTVGETVTLLGTGFGPGDLVTITLIPITTDGGAGHGEAWAPSNRWKSKQYYIRADENGNFRTEVIMREPGRTAIVATGVPSGVSATVVVTVLPLSMADTGSGSGLLLRVGAGALAGGVSLLAMTLLWHRRAGRSRA